jgi:hypothetical protein
MSRGARLIGCTLYRLVPVLVLIASAAAQQPAVLVYHFERTGLPVPEYTITVHEDGSGTYAATYLAPVADTTRYGAMNTTVPAPPTNATQVMTLSAGTTAKLFEKVRVRGQLLGCESKQKNIAQTGNKTIRYSGPDAEVSCTFNYTENKSVDWMNDTFQAIAQTMDQGRTIEQKHRYDRLGLDRVLTSLVDEVKEGRAQEIGTIAPILQSLVDDTQVMERVRKRAAGLLVMSSVATGK